MRPVIAVLIAIAASSSPVATQQRESSPRPDRISACSLLSRELVRKVSPVDRKPAFELPPEEEPIGQKGSSCEYGGIGLQVNPFARADEMRKSMGKEWEPVSGVGDTAFFRNNRNLFAELLVWTGAHHFTIQMGVPTDGTAEKIKPNTIALANAIIPQLK